MSALWTAMHIFGEDAVSAVLGVSGGADRELSKAELQQIARSSARSFWVDGRTLLGRDPGADRPAAKKLSAEQALLKYGIAKLSEARERGGAILEA